MGFNEKTRLEVKRKSGFQCCRCHEIGIDVHHIIPQAENGSDNIDNAAPLCQNCHDRFGANSEKRKEIRQMRDWWYEVMLEKYPLDQEVKLNPFSEINELILRMHTENKESTNALKQELSSKLEELKKNSLLNMADNESAIKTKVSQYISATTLGDKIHANFQCRKCNTYIGLLIGSNECPNCHTPF